jgi:hypothetical protein
LAAALVDVGEFAPVDVFVLENPTKDQVLGVVARTRELLAGPSGLFLFYYSGHADAEQLHLAGGALRHGELAAMLKGHPSKVKTAFLDACHAGSLLTAKGARPARSFELSVDDALAVSGTAIVASSGADELSQESRALKGSLFTHHLVSALRGAADLDGDGRVTLTEAYGFTLARTALGSMNARSAVQRPEFQVDFKGRGEVVLSRFGPAHGALVLPAALGHCFVTDDAERRLWAEVSGSASATLRLPPGNYVVKCTRAGSLRVAAVGLRSGAVAEPAEATFMAVTASAAVLKGDGTERQSELAQWKETGFGALREHRPIDALDFFTQALNRDPRDAEAFRGKAQAYVVLSRRASEEGNHRAADEYRTLAVRADPALGDDPEFRRLFPAPTAPALPRDLGSFNVERAYPRQHQFIAAGVGLFTPHGPLTLEFDVLVREWLALDVQLCPMFAGLGASVRWLPRSGSWTPYAALGGNVTLAGLGLLNGPDVRVRSQDTVLVSRDHFDRLVYVEGGLQWASRRLQLEGGLAFAYGWPSQSAAYFGVFPSLSVRYAF